MFGGDPVPLKLTFDQPLQHWTAYEKDPSLYLPLFGEIPDVKFLWEPARFSWVFTLGRAYHLTREERYAEAFWKFSEPFMEGNPPNMGPNWVSAQEVALRLLAFCWSLQIFADSKHSTPARKEKLVRSIAAACSPHPVHPGLCPLAEQQPPAQRGSWLVHSQLGAERPPGCRSMASAGLERISSRPSTNRWMLPVNMSSTAATTSAWCCSSPCGWDPWLTDITSFFRSAAGKPWREPPTGLTPCSTRSAAACPTWAPMTGLPAAHWQAVLLRSPSGDPGSSRAVSWATACRQAPGMKCPCGLVFRTLKKYFETPRYLGDAIYGRESWGILRAVRYRSRPSHADQLHFDLWWRGIEHCPGCRHLSV